MSKLRDVEKLPVKWGIEVSFPETLDALRQSLPPVRTRSRATDFRTWAKSLPVRRKPSGTEWAVTVGDKRLMYDIRKASAAGTLVVYSHFVRYEAEGCHGSLKAPLFRTPVAFDAAAATARPTGRRSLNTALVDTLMALGVTVDASGDMPILEGPSATASLWGDDRVAVEVGEPMQPAAYFDHTTNPAVLTNPLLRLFVEGVGGDTLAWTMASEQRLQAAPPSAGTPVPLDTDQRAAVEMAIASRACLIDGPPGTGKTQVIAALAEHASAGGLRLLVTSTEPSAIAVAKRRTAGIGAVVAMMIDEIAAMPPPVIGEPDFDIVVIDEASRMTFVRAATVLVRARSVVIIGDDRQMRPDLGGETIIERAKTLNLPRRMMRCHYRSRERSLITTCNLLSYNMQLRSVPTPALDPSIGLRVAVLEGTSEETSAGAENRVEAGAIIARLKKHASTKDRRSIGVITANRAQRDLIRRLVKETMTKGEIDALSPLASEPLLVVTATEAQGEERDICLISMVYTQSSKSYGVFQRSGGMSVLNVMLSRAREEMAILTCYKAGAWDGESERPSSRALMDAMFACLDAATTTETRQQPPPAYVSLAQTLNVQIDHLGVVLGLRRQTDDAYRVGIVPISDQKSGDHWDMIENQLQAFRWNTIRLTEAECRTARSSVLARIKDLFER